MNVVGAEPEKKDPTEMIFAFCVCQSSSFVSESWKGYRLFHLLLVLLLTNSLSCSHDTSNGCCCEQLRSAVLFLPLPHM